MKRESSICSIFGQIEGVVARAMAEEKKVHLIEPDMIPLTARFDQQGRKAECAVVFTPKTEIEFNRRVAALYA